LLEEGEEFTLLIKKTLNLKQDKNKLKWIMTLTKTLGTILLNLSFGDL
tara:strand:- start:336 stop:479 length:144 start_codon:yes stop_codon:yes gene_type:complete